MKDYYQIEIIRLSETEVQRLIGQTFKIYLNTVDLLDGIDYSLAKIIDYDITIDKVIYSLTVKSLKTSKNIIIPILRINRLEYVC